MAGTTQKRAVSSKAGGRVKARAGVRAATRAAAADQAAASDRETARTNDLRYRRTERHLHQALEDELAERSLRQVKVTQVARRAEVSTAAFYLHYRDIFDLAEAYARSLARRQVDEMDFLEEFFSSPRDFVRHYVEFFDTRHDQGDRIFGNGLVKPYFDQLVRSIKERLDAMDGGGRAGDEVFLTFLVHGLMSLIPNFPDRLDEATQVVGDAVENLKLGRETRASAAG